MNDHDELDFGIKLRNPAAIREFKVFGGSAGGYPVHPSDCFIMDDKAEDLYERLRSVDLHGFKYDDLKSRGASDQSIELVIEKYKLQEKYPEQDLHLHKVNDQHIWIFDTLPE